MNGNVGALGASAGWKQITADEDYDGPVFFILATHTQFVKN